MLLVQLWENFSSIKHTLRGIYHSNWKISSGKNEDDAILVCMKIHWAVKRNKVIKTTNKKKAESSPPGELRKLVTADDAPANLNQTPNLFPEAVLYLLVKQHPIIVQGDNSPKRKVLQKLTSGSGETADDEEEEDEEEKLVTGMSNKGNFTSRKKQRSNDTRLKRRALLAKKNQASGMKEKAALIHASAAKKQADNQLAQTQLAAIESARKLGGIPVDVLKGYLRQTMGSLFAVENPAPSATAPVSGAETEREDAAMVAAEQLSMMSATEGVAGTVSLGSDSDIEVVEEHERTDQ